jgi:ribosomal protein RSM22 (predicted rRNA methylase)
MDLTLSAFLPHLIYTFKSESELVLAIDELSEKFTRNRERITDYLREPRLVAAYTAFYTLTNIPKLREVLRWMPQDWVEEVKRSTFVDLGAGPGTFSLAWRKVGASGPVYQVEHSPLMREQAAKLWSAFGEGQLVQGQRWEWNVSNPKLLLFGHSANEMDVATAIRYIDAINPDHVLFIEPGTKEFFGKMLELRAHLLGAGHHVLFPCPLPTACPMQGSADWCHQFIHVRQDPEVERLTQLARKDRKLLPLTVQAFSRTFRADNPRERVVRVHLETKFGHDWEVCHDNQLQRYQILKRDLSKVESKALGELRAGASVLTEVIKETEQFTRVKLIHFDKL